MSADPDEAAELAFRQALSDALAANPLDQKQLATACGMTPQTMTNLKTGASRPSFKTLRGLVAGLALDPWKALDISPPTHIPPQPPVPVIPDQESRDILMALVAAARGLRPHTADLIDAFRRAEDYVRRTVEE